MSTLSGALTSLGYETDSNGNPIIETPLATARPNPSSTATPNTSILSQLESATSKIADEESGTKNSTAQATGLFAQFEQWLTTSSTNIVAVLIGLVLVAGAVWGFDAVKETVTSTAKGAAKLAA